MVSAIIVSRISSGFSLIELVAVLVIIGALAVVAVPRFADSATYEARGFVDETAAAARYAQRLAAASGCAVQFSVAAGGYSLQHEDPCDSDTFGSFPVRHPARSENFAGTTPSGVTVSVSGAGTLVFDALGRPSSSSQVTVSANGFSRTFIVHPETGYVETL